MSPTIILLIGMAVVLGGVLILRVHAFLALLAAALIVSWLTPGAAVYEHELRSREIQVVEAGSEFFTLQAGSGDELFEGAVLVVMRVGPESGKPTEVARLRVAELMVGRARARVVSYESSYSYLAGDLIVPVSVPPTAAELSSRSIGAHVATGFGQTCMGIGIIIAMASIIGKCLLDSGGAERVVLSASRAFGEERSGMTFLGSGFTVAIPVFFDTVFYLLVPLAKAMNVTTGKHYVLYILTIVTGAALAHSLVPPTPGPLFVANEMGVDLGLMILGGGLVGLFALPFGYLFSVWADRRWDIPLRPSVDLSAEELKAIAHRDEASLPPLWLSILPILLPVVLIAGNTVLGMLGADTVPSLVRSAVGLAGDKNVALTLAGAVALALLARQKRGDRKMVSEAVQAALASGGIIILITAAGGAFGHVLRLTGIADELKSLISATQFLILPAAFATTSLIRIAQGSATVAMITAVGIFGPIAATGGFAFHPLYIALAIGCGSMPYPWMNDSGFWIIRTMSGFTEAETLKTASVVIALMGFAGFAATLLGAWLFPLV